MSEYDYSPGTRARYRETQNSVVRWAHETAEYPSLCDPFKTRAVPEVPSESGSSESETPRSWYYPKGSVTASSLKRSQATAVPPPSPPTSQSWYRPKRTLSPTSPSKTNGPTDAVKILGPSTPHLVRQKQSRTHHRSENGQKLSSGPMALTHSEHRPIVYASSSYSSLTRPKRADPSRTRSPYSSAKGKYASASSPCLQLAPHKPFVLAYSVKTLPKASKAPTAPIASPVRVRRTKNDLRSRSCSSVATAVNPVALPSTTQVLVSDEGAWIPRGEWNGILIAPQHGEHTQAFLPQTRTQAEHGVTARARTKSHGHLQAKFMSRFSSDTEMHQDIKRKGLLGRLMERLN